MSYKTFLKHKPNVEAFFDDSTNTITYVVSDPKTKKAAIIDSVMDFEPKSGTVSFESANRIVEFIKKNKLSIDWILETHVHADHLTAAAYLKQIFGGKIAISEHIVDVQKTFADVFGEDKSFKRDGSQFDTLLKHNDTFSIGDIPVKVLHTPGHTPADMVFIIGDAVFAGDTLFMPDFGTARCDFPGGSAESLYKSSQEIFALPNEMRMFICHDYLPNGRNEYVWETTIAEQQTKNIHVRSGIAMEEFVSMRTQRDEELGMPNLIIPSIQVNMRAGKLPKPDGDGNVFFKTPINGAFSKTHSKELDSIL